MLPAQPLPLHPIWSSADEYVQSLLALVTSSDLLRNLCGGVHILDFLIRKPDLYSWVLPDSWREWFELVEIDDLLDLLFREDLVQFNGDEQETAQEDAREWRGLPHPPASLITYIKTIRIHSLDRSYAATSQRTRPLPRRIGIGMKPKKAHEVANFAAFVDALSARVSEQMSEPPSIVDFGSGQNYLGRTLAQAPYNKHVIAIERHHHNVEGARGMDVSAKLAKKDKIMRNRKLYKKKLKFAKENGLPKPPEEVADYEPSPASTDPEAEDDVAENVLEDGEDTAPPAGVRQGSMTYIEHELVDGRLEHILYPSTTSNRDHTAKTQNHELYKKSIAVSIHSCGNLTHHGLRSLVVNPSITAVAMIGCCYNLLTERLGPATYKLPQLRSNHPRLEATSSTYDPHGFPMSKHLENFEYEINTNSSHVSLSSTAPPAPSTTTQSASKQREKGVRLNITARMMAVQAPMNWTPVESSTFFTRHFYRALLQRILLDRGVVKQAISPSTLEPGNSLTGKDDTGTPLIIGSLRKTAFVSFPAYVEAALTKLWNPSPDDTNPNSRVDGSTTTTTAAAKLAREEAAHIKSLTQDLIYTPEGRELIAEYEQRFAYARKHLSVIWSLMAFSASVVESTIIVDRWLWLTEQEEVSQAWVQPVFDYALSPRNMVVVGIKKPDVDADGDDVALTDAGVGAGVKR